MSDELDIDHDDELDAQLIEFWDRCCVAHAGNPGQIDPESPWDAFAFSWPEADTAAIDDLAQRVVQRRKQATTALFWEHEESDTPLPVPGDYHIILDAAGAPRAIVRTTQVDVVALNAVDEHYAAIEGEGDGSLAYWREAHIRVFNAMARQLGRIPTPDMPVVCERFELVYTGEAI